MVKQIFEARDGKQFETEHEAIQYEAKLDDRAKKYFEKYLTSWDYTEGLKKMPLNTQGIWEVRGEDHNCDLGGHHHNPLIGHVEGTLEQAILFGCASPKWSAWGRGGQIRKLEIKKM